MIAPEDIFATLADNRERELYTITCTLVLSARAVFPTLPDTLIDAAAQLACHMARSLMASDAALATLARRASAELGPDATTLDRRTMSQVRSLACDLVAEETLRLLTEAYLANPDWEHAVCERIDASGT